MIILFFKYLKSNEFEKCGNKNNLNRKRPIHFPTPIACQSYGHKLHFNNWNKKNMYAQL